jgi:hypothetical protein
MPRGAAVPGRRSRSKFQIILHRFRERFSHKNLECCTCMNGTSNPTSKFVDTPESTPAELVVCMSLRLLMRSLRECLKGFIFAKNIK